MRLPTRGCSTRNRKRPSATDLVWIGNWGDGEREQELTEFLIEPSRASGIERHCARRALSRTALAALRSTSLRYGGWIANADVPALFARHRMTIHVPRRPYVDGTARHSHHPRFRGARLRHPAGLRAMARRGGAVPSGRFPARGEWRTR